MSKIIRSRATNRAERVLEQYVAIVGDKDAPVKQHTTDLVADLMHLADKAEVNWNDVYCMASIYHDAEVKGE